MQSVEDARLLERFNSPIEVVNRIRDLISTVAWYVEVEPGLVADEVLIRLRNSSTNNEDEIRFFTKVMINDILVNK